jgi:F0F1-type ATP synthase delta subunit
MSTVSRQDLATIVADKSKNMSHDDLIKMVAAYLSDTGETINVEDLVRDIMQLRLQDGFVEAVVVMAHEPTNLVLEDVKKLLKEHFPYAKKILLDVRIDESVVGGISIQLPQETLDLTVRAKLNRFKRLIEERN